MQAKVKKTKVEKYDHLKKKKILTTKHNFSSVIKTSYKNIHRQRCNKRCVF